MALQTLLILPCFILISLIYSQDIDPTWKIFEDPYAEKLPLSLLTVHNVTGDVYVASGNALYHLDADLVLKQKVVKDTQRVCKTPLSTCDNMTTKFHIPHTLEIVYHLESPMLMMCSALYDGMCELRFLSNLDYIFWIGPYNEGVAHCTKKTHDPGFFGPGYGNQLVFYSGADWDPAKDSKDDPRPFISSKVLLYENGQYRFKYSYRRNESMSAIFFRQEYEQILIYSFIYESHVYFLFLRMNPVSTILARICIGDGTFHSYVELPISCRQGTTLHNGASSAFLGPPPEHLKRLFPKSKNLYIAFLSRNVGTVICGFSMNELKDLFYLGMKDCFEKGNDTGLLNPDNGNLTSCTRKTPMESEDYCGSDVNHYIHIKSTARAQLYTSLNMDGFYVTALNVFEQNNQIVAFIGGPNFNFAKILLFNDEPFLHISKAEEVGVATSVAFDLKQEHIYFLSGEKVIKYPIGSCSLYKTCYECFTAMNDPLGCGWCDGHCAQRHECTNSESFNPGKCTPFIQMVEPLIGPTQGVTHLKIVGTNFGRYSKNKFNYVTVAGIECLIILWENEKILCSTHPLPSPVTGNVKLSTKDTSNESLPFVYEGLAESKETFTFVTPKLLGISPGRGPHIGGTNVTLFGEHLDIGKEYLMNIHGRMCTQLRVRKSTATCLTGSSVNLDLKDAIEMKIDDISIGIDKDARIMSPFATNTSDDFKYLLDPEISKIHPTATIISLGGNLTITGRYLDSAIKHLMLLRINSTDVQNLEYEQPCWLTPKSDGTTMVCSMPPLKSNDFSFQLGKPILAQVTFQMDGDRKVFSNLSQLNFYPEPKFEIFQKVREVPKNETLLKISGKYSSARCEADVINVKIGDSHCKIAIISFKNLYCTLPQELLTNASVWGKSLSVQVSTGSNHRHLGYVIIKERDLAPEQMPWIIILASVLVVILCLTVVIGGWYFYRWRKRNNFSKSEIRTPGFTLFPGDISFRKDCRPVPLSQKTEETTILSPFEETALITRPRTFIREPSTSTTTRIMPPVTSLEETTAKVPFSRTFSREPSTSTTTSLTSPARSHEETAAKLPFTRTFSGEPSTTTSLLPNMNQSNKAPNGSASFKQLHEPTLDSPNQLMIQRTNSFMSDTFFNETLRLLTLEGLLVEREHLYFGGVIGAGQFGCVYKANYSCPKKGNIKVAVKTIRNDCQITEQTVEEFLTEGLQMRNFHHEHVIELIGICFENRLPMVITHFMPNGDLCNYLRDIKNVLWVGDLLKFAVHVAAGMAYLSDARFVHRDLAARNCMIDGDLKVKIGDFGLSRDIYESDYYQSENNNRKLPLKWMAPETIELDNKYTVQSDVWSYGVVVWEIMTRGVLPYEEVGKWGFVEYIKAGNRLPRPLHCPKTLYQVMLTCWDSKPSERPSFHELHRVMKSVWESTSLQDRKRMANAQNHLYTNTDD